MLGRSFSMEECHAGPRENTPTRACSPSDQQVSTALADKRRLTLISYLRQCSPMTETRRSLGPSVFRENVILGTMSGPASAVSILIPLYLNHLGYSVGAIGSMLAIAGVATLLSRIPVPKLYRPERSRALILVTLAAGGISFAVLPFIE